MPGVADEEPQAVGGYRLLRRLGGGGMGTVYEAREIASGRRVALKLIAAEHGESAEALERFRREGRLASAIAHPRCVFVLAADEDAGRPYIVMELMPGATLADLLKERGRLPPEEAIAKVLEVLEGLQEAHRLGVVHRDVKPSNCFLDADSRVKVGDFGLSKSLLAEAHLTRTGLFLGTPLFASPEQVRGEAVGPQSDLYSLAATLYCLLTGKAPFEGGDAAVTLARIAADPAPSIRTLRPELSPALDRVVLRGLERDRQKRWQDLEAFKQALLPFLPASLEAAWPGVRLAAFLIDYLATVVLGMALTAAHAAAVGGRLFPTDLQSSQEFAPLRFLLGIPIWLGCFLVPEWLWGSTLGKRLLRLRVCTLASSDPPNLIRAVARFAVFYLLFFHLTAFVFLLWQPDLPDRPDREQALLLATVGALFWVLWGLGILLIVSTMRRRNGWRGLHEFASGTRVIQLPERQTRPALRTRPLEDAVTRPRDLPEQVGPYAVRGALLWTEQGRVLLGEDRGLLRPVLLWLRPAAAPPLSPARRECGRDTRLRWLAAGRQDDWQWDAFLAPSGQALPDLVAAEGRLPWPEVRPIVERLTEELAIAADEDALPDVLGPGQIWVPSGGGALLLDMPLAPQESEAAANQLPQPQQALALLGRAAVLALEGRPRPADRANEAPQPIRALSPVHRVFTGYVIRRNQDPPPIRAPLPEHASHFFGRLLGKGRPFRDLREVRAELRATRDRPAVVTRGRRAAHLAVLAALLFVGTCFCLMPMGWVNGYAHLIVLSVHHKQNRRVLRELDERAVADFANGVLSPQPLARAAAACQLYADGKLCDRLRDRVAADEREFKARREAANWASREQFRFMQQALVQQEARAGNQERRPAADVRFEARWRAEAADTSRQLAWRTGIFLLITLGVWPLLWVVWAFLFRGGLSFPLLGLSLVRADGRRAGRFLCGWRAVLVWGPLTGLLLAAVWLETWFWSAAARPQPWVLWMAELLRWSSLALLLTYPVLALFFPRRGPHDRLAGTYLVPR
jgi:hypothetical protein